MRLDKFLSEVTEFTRSEVKQFIKKKQVTVNGKQITDSGFKVDEFKDAVFLQEEKLTYQKYFYYLLHKPQGVISATKDQQKTVIDLLAKGDYRKDLFPVGRLDKDTEGLLLITNDGVLAHNLLSPKKHVEKEYFAEISGLVTEKEQQAFLKGLTLDGNEKTLPSQLKIVETDPLTQTSKITLVIKEGKYHQVKRMFQAVGMKVTYLKRIRMAQLTLGTLPLGKYRVLTKEEVAALQQAN